MLWGWRIVFFIYRTYVCPNTIDTIALIGVAILLGLVAKVLNPLSVLLVLVIIALAAPAILTRTPLGSKLSALIEDLKKKRKEKQDAASK
jgi:hypothetical protein